MSKNIISLAQEANALEQLLMEAGGELNPTFEQWISEIDSQLEVKADNYAFVLDRFCASATMLKERAKRYADAAKAIENAHDRIKERIKAAIQVSGRSEIKGGEVTFKISNSAPRLVLDETQLDPAYLITITQLVPDKERIKTDLKNGLEVKGARLEPVHALRRGVSK